MTGLVPAIHALQCEQVAKAWMPGTRPGMTGFYFSPGIGTPSVCTIKNALSISTSALPATAAI